MSNPVATWSISLDIDCPGCGKYVDLLDDGEFWCDRQFQAVEHDTPATKGVDVMCPECGYEFDVDLEY